jgi:hypothetical protein
MGYLFSVREIENRNGEVAWLVCNADGRGSGDVLRAVNSLGSPHRPGRARHPALDEHETEAEAVAAMERLGADLAAHHGGAYQRLEG